MKIRAECVPCLLTRGLFECRISSHDNGGRKLDDKEAKAMQAAVKVFAKEYSPRKCSATVATKVHRAIYKALGDEDPYREIKGRSNDVALRLLPKAKRFIKASDDPLEAAVLLSIIGNLLDFGIPGVLDDPDALDTMFDDIAAHGLDVDHTSRLRPLLKPGKTIVYLTDNAGEIVFDSLVCEVLMSYGPKVLLVVKGAPILTDATLKDAKDSGIDGHVDAILTTGSNAVGLDLSEMGPELKKALFGADLVIAKGMANYEALSEPDFKRLKNVIYILRTKCHPVAQGLGVGKDLNVAIFKRNTR
jgi:damage-control phosphatase, subfamily I